MVRYLIFVLFCLIVQGCCYKGLHNEYYFARKKIRVDYKLDKEIYNLIDTNSVYEHIGYYEENKIEVEKNYTMGKMFLKFYGNGKVGFFVRVGYNRKTFKIIPNYQISKDDFDPSKSYMGYYYLHKDRIIANQFLHNQCQMFYTKSEIFAKKDTIIQVFKRFYNSGVYVKKKVPTEWLSKQPDW